MSENVAEVEEVQEAKPRMSKKERMILDQQAAYLRGARRVLKTEKEYLLAEGARDRAIGRLIAAEEKLDRYVTDRDDAATFLVALGADVPEFVPEDEDETEDENGEAVEPTEDEIVSEDEEELSDVRV